MARVFTLSSGSDGNCAYIGDAKSGILIDLGISLKKLKAQLDEYDMSLQNIEAVLLTHEHSDHIKGLATFIKQTDIPIYSSPKTAEYINEHNPDVAGRIIPLEENIDCKLERTCFIAYKVYHDSVEAYGYKIKTADDRIVCYATDTGHFDEELFNSVKGSDLCIIEANHDEGMLSCNISYPYLLKKRILGEFGHLSNSACAEAVLKLLRSNTRRFILAHLSSQNNTPQVAFEAVNSALKCEGYVRDVDYIIEVAPRLENSRMMIF